MKNILKFGLWAGALLLFASSFTACKKDKDSDPAQTLSQEEIASLQFMYEEEKLARDVYLYLFDAYDHMVFDHISGSEQTHMDAIQTLMDKYEVENDATDVRGEFVDADLQALYVQLTAQGDQSLIEALTVGATIEDLDIYDLQQAITTFNNEDIINVYESLACGSRNHIRAFSKHLDLEGGSYIAQFISQEEYQTILSGNHESCGL